MKIIFTWLAEAVRERMHVVQGFLMWAVAPILTWKGLDTMIHGVSSIAGLLTVLCGTGMGVCGFIWWIRRLKRQRIKIRMEELTLEKMEKHRPHRAKPDPESET